MTEEIIIDGVNVAGCDNLYEKDDMICVDNGIEESCQGNNCYYKQLKRTEQENEELKEMLSKEPKAMQAFQIAYSGLKKENEVLWGMVKDYKTALEEILESAKFAQSLPCGSGNLEDCLNCNDDTTNNGQFCMEKRIQEIKTKCVEVLNESK